MFRFFRSIQTSIRAKLITAYLALTIPAISAILLTFVLILDTRMAVDRVQLVRRESLRAATSLSLGIESSQAELRSYILQGNLESRLGWIEAWEDVIEPALGTLQRLAESEPGVSQDLADLKRQLRELRVTQQQVDEVAHAKENRPATTGFFEEVAPRARVLSENLAAMIDLEGSLDTSADRKALLIKLADLQIAIALSFDNLRGFLNSGAESFHEEFDRQWTRARKLLGELERMRPLMVSDQAVHFRIILSTAVQLEGIPERLVAFRTGPDWDRARSLMRSQITPLAHGIQSRIRTLVLDQFTLLGRDVGDIGDHSRRTREILFLLLVGGLGLGYVVSHVIGRAITRPLSDLVRASDRLAGGEPVQIPITGQDEIGELGQAFNRMAAELGRQREELRDRARQLEASDQYKSEFLARVSHELRTPLHSLMLTTEVLAGDRDSHITPRQKELLGTVRASGRDLMELINTLLDLGRLESGTPDIRPVLYRLTALEEQVHRYFDPVAAEKGLRLTILRAADVPETLLVDGKRLGHIVTNLLANAFKFTGDGQVELTIGVRRTPDPAGTDPPMLEFAVVDTGCGIPIHLHERIFEPFFQVPDPSAGPGTGLGLSICRQLAAAMGGRITMQSASGQGSRFVLELPLFEECGTLPEPATGEVAGSSGPASIAHPRPGTFLEGRTILIVDDDVRNLFALRALLGNQGARVLHARSAVECLERLGDTPGVHLILMDVMMPDVDGLETTRRLRLCPETRELPVLGLTAMGPAAGDACRAAGMDDVLSKPVEPGELFSRISHWIDARRPAA